MDSLTQLVLGAAMAELALGRKVGNKAPLWGAICGTIPDLDVLFNPLLSDLQELGSHRGFSHSIFFTTLLAPLLGYLLSLFYRKKEANWVEWTVMCFLALVTHPLLDAFTNYGTQLFLPFSDYRVAFNSIFIVDPIYTMPMLLALVILLFVNRKKPLRAHLNTIAVFISHLYLLGTLANKVYISTVFTQALYEKNISYQRYYTNPMPLQNVLWNCIAEDTASYYMGYYSWFDADKKICFRQVLKNDEGLRELKQTFALKRLDWFSNGYAVFTRNQGELFYNDLRFGKMSGLVNDSGSFVYSWKIVRRHGHIEFERHHPTFEWNPAGFQILISRVSGIKKDSL